MVDFHLSYTSLNSFDMRKAALLIAILFVNLGLYAQEVVSPAGETQTASGFEVSWTVGSLAIETLTSGSYTLTQGFHQTRLSVTRITESPLPDIDLKVFPNPAQDFIIIQFEELNETPSYALYNVTGKLMESKIITSTTTQLEMQNYATGQYILKLTSESGKPLHSFKIVKVF